MELYGRRAIYISDDISRENILDVLKKCLLVHNQNKAEITYLYDYYRGKQDIRNREKTFNDFINNKICENRALQIVNFKTAYMCGEPIRYSDSDGNYADAVDLLNNYCRLEGKDTLDYDLVEWMNIAGTAYRLVLPKQYIDESPFILSTIDPRNSFVAYSSKITHEQNLCCYLTTEDDVTTYSVYAKTNEGIKFFEIVGEEIREQDWTLSYLPIIEYPHGKARLGAFEVVLSLLDAVNSLDSNRLDSIEQFVQSLLVLINCKLPKDTTANTIKEMGLIELVSNDQNRADIQQIVNTLDQSNTQTLKEDMMEAIRTIVSMPNVSSSNYGGGDNGLAVVYRNGWEGAYEAALTDQKAIDQSEYQSLRLMLEICRETNTVDIPLSAIHIDYTRQHYENMATKSATLVSMLNNPLIHPKDAYEVCGLFYDPNKKYMNGMEWYESQKTEITNEENSPEAETIEI